MVRSGKMMKAISLFFSHPKRYFGGEEKVEDKRFLGEMSIILSKIIFNSIILNCRKFLLIGP